MHITFTSALPGIDWFEAGEAVYLYRIDDPRFYPPADDAESLRYWCGGLAAAWVEADDERTLEQVFSDSLRRLPKLHAAIQRRPWPRKGAVIP